MGPFIIKIRPLFSLTFKVLVNTVILFYWLEADMLRYNWFVISWYFFLKIYLEIPPIIIFFTCINTCYICMSPLRGCWNKVIFRQNVIKCQNSYILVCGTLIKKRPLYFLKLLKLKKIFSRLKASKWIYNYFYFTTWICCLYTLEKWKKIFSNWFKM